MMKSDSWSVVVYGGEMSLNGKNVCPALLKTLGTPIFMFCVTDFCWMGKPTLYLRAPTMLRTMHTPKNATVKNFTSTDFLGPIRFDSPNGGTFNSLIKK